MRIDPKGNPEDARESGEFKVHYHLNGGVHRMDAVVRNRAEGELLANERDFPVPGEPRPVGLRFTAT